LAKIRILILYLGSIARNTGTSERVLQVARALAGQDAKVVFSASVRDSPENQKPCEKMNIIRMPSSILMPLDVLRWIIKLITTALTHGLYDIVQVEEFSFLRSLTLYFLLRPFGRKFIIVFHDKCWECDPRRTLSGRLEVMLQRLLLIVFNASITPGLTVKKWLEELHGTQLCRKIVVIPNGVPNLNVKNNLDYKRLREKYGIDPNAFIALFFGSMTFKPNREAAMHLYKISDFLSHRFEEITERKLIFLVAGVGSKALPEMQCFVPLGFVKELSELLSLPDVIVFPHTPSYSGPHVKTIYGFLSKKPVIATEDAVKDMPGVTEGREFILFNIYEPSTLLNAIVDIYYHKELKESLATNAYLYSKKFSWQYVSSLHLRLYEKLMSV